MTPERFTQIGRRLGVYEIRAVLGSGGMGDVYRARDTRLERDVAIKILPPAFVRDAGRLERFEREARVLASLDHPNIATIHGVEENEGCVPSSWRWWMVRPCVLGSRANDCPLIPSSTSPARSFER
jgi:serine/threonine protein kinase